MGEADRAAAVSQGLVWEPPKVRWWLVAVFALTGLGLVALAIALDLAWKVDDIWPAVALEFGTTVGLFGFLVAVEPRLVEHVAEQASPRCHVVEPPARTHIASMFGGTMRKCSHEPPHYWTLDGARDPTFGQEEP